MFDGILHGWVFNPGPGMRWDTYGKIVAMLEEKFEAVQRDRMRSFIEPPKPIPVKIAHDCCRLFLPVVLLDRRQGRRRIHCCSRIVLWFECDCC